MSGGDGQDDERTARIERGVLARIDRRAATRAAIVRGATGLAVAAVLVAGVAALAPRSSSSESTAAGGAAGREPLTSSRAANGSASPTAAADAAPSVRSVRCHATSAADSAVRTRPLSAASSPSPSIEALCAAAFARHPSPMVVCRVGAGVVAAFPADGEAAGLCRRNGLRPAG